MQQVEPKPVWLRVRAPGGERLHETQKTLRSLGLNTVCEKARCPNVGDCWREGTATVMLLGDVCTRGCRFCAVAAGKPAAPAPDEPLRVARAIAKMALRYVVLTMVSRDDLPDGGADHVARTVRALRDLGASVLVETLVGDFQGQEGPIGTVISAGPAVFAHNVEVVRRMTPIVRDVRSDYGRSLDVLKRSKMLAPSIVTKSSVMVGVGETDQEVIETLSDLRASGVDIVTIGQYLRPSPRHHPVVRYVPPDVFASYRDAAISMGFGYVASAPLVRSSYRAAEAFVRRASSGAAQSHETGQTLENGGGKPQTDLSDRPPFPPGHRFG
jgi:lipoyl synthase